MWFAEGEVDFTLTFTESVINVPYFLSIPEVAAEAIKDIVLGIIFCIVGGGSYVVNKLKNVKNAKNNANFAPAPEAASAEAPAEDAALNDCAVPENEDAVPEAEPEQAEEAPAEEKKAE